MKLRTAAVGLTAAVLVSTVSLALPAQGALPNAGGTVDSPAARKVDWRQYHATPNHRGINKAEKVVDAETVGRLGLSWIGNGATSQDDLVFKSSPAVVDGFVYFGTTAGQVLAFRDDCAGSSCDPVWRANVGATITSSPAVVDGVLYIGSSSEDGRLYAYDVAECAAHGGCDPLWSADFNDNGSSPTVSHGVVYVGSWETGVYAFDAAGCGKATCQPLWIGKTSGYVINAPAVAKGVVYAGDSDGFLYAFDANGCGKATCQPMWKGVASGPIYSSSPAVKGGFVYTTSFAAEPDSHLEVFDAAGCGAKTCAPAWESVGLGYLDSPPAVGYGNVYIGSEEATLLVFPAKGCGAKTCAPKWTGYGAGPVAAMQSAPMLADGVVYAGANNSRVRAWNARGCGSSLCDKLWEFITQDPLVNSSPVLVNSTLYVTGTNFGAVPELYVFDLN
jgi:outer membrane protein assembly factor BamB